ncbi:MAG: N-acetylmuramoyl-L-alanine amidase [Labilithrix sp.]|nr:N-acetylmuramoyl-L-alanine amidase [Labilithrix sp.]
MKTIRRGDKGADVSAWQAILVAGPRPTKWTNAAGAAREWRADWAWPIRVDGDFGERTEAASEAWQDARGLVADGVVGPKTWGAAGKKTEAAPASTTGLSWVESPNKNVGRKQRVRVIVVHTMEMNEVARGAESCARYFARPETRASAHYCVDATSTWQCVRDEDTAWHAGAVNDYAIGIEHAGFAKQTAAEWDDDYSTKMLARSAALAAELCVRFGIPPKKLGVAELVAGEGGLCGHVDATNGFANGKGHWDPGPNFPWQAYVAAVADGVRALGGTVTATDTADPIDTSAWIEVEHGGATWLVAPRYVAGVGIGEAAELARQSGCVLPTPDLVDAIWKRADLKIDAATLVRSDFKEWSMAEMSSASVLADQAKRIDAQIGGRAFTLLAGTHKDVARHPDGRIGLYGWHRASGQPIQGFFDKHAASWKDYSQGLRLVKKKG